MDQLKGKIVKRVELDFAWPLGEPWHGYINPWPGPEPCWTCRGMGYNEDTDRLFRTFDSWAPRVTKFEIDVLKGQGFVDEHIKGLKSRTLKGIDDPVLRIALVDIRARRKGVWGECPDCEGTGELPNFNPAVMALYEGVNLYETWEPVDPPVGEGWQLWDDYGVPLSPVMADADGLAKWCHKQFPEMTARAWQQWILAYKPEAPSGQSDWSFRLMADNLPVPIGPVN